MLAQQRAAKMRAVMEVSGAAAAARISSSGSASLTGGIRSKVRHHGAPKALQYTPASHPASGVPMRLSANEVDDEEEEEETSRSFHRRTGSSRSSLGSGVWNPQQMGNNNSSSNNNTSGSNPSSGPHSQGHSPNAVAESSQPRPSEEETPVPGNFRGSDYFAAPPPPPTTSPGESGGSLGSGSERENSFGGVGGLPKRVGPKETMLKPEADELQRRGSVDERTTTMSGYGRLFVANPDVD